MISGIKAWAGNNPVVAAIAGFAAAGVLAGLIGFGIVGLGSSTDSDSDQAREGMAAEGAVVPECLAGEGLDVSLPSDVGADATTGTLELQTIGGVRLTGTYDCDESGDWTITIDGGDGSVGGVDLDSFAGTIVSATGVISSDVVATMADLPAIVPEWEQSASVEFPYESGALAANVLVETERGDNSVSLAGPLLVFISSSSGRI